MRVRPWSALLAVLLAAPAAASPLEFVSPRDPLVAELRVLECMDLPADGRWRLPHFNSWPLQRVELMGTGAPPLAGSPVRSLAARRLERELQRDATVAFAHPSSPRSTPRAWAPSPSDDERFEMSIGFEGGYEGRDVGGRRSTGWRDGSGLHVRTGMQVDRWLAFAHLTAGQLRGASRYTDVLLARTDLAAQTDEAYVAYAAGTRWWLAMGRQRFAWGPGEEGSLMLSRTAAPLTALALHGRLERLRADFVAVHATVDPGRGEQLAAHRIEWQPSAGVRVAMSEAARYRSSGWQGVYLASVIPFPLAQRLLQQDGDTASVNRNNVELGLDASWRVADGTRVYGEVLIDDAHARSAAFPNKYGWQVGLDGVWSHGPTRVTWNTEYTFTSRYLYTSYFGRDFTAQDAPLGFPTGPDARRLRVRMTWDPAVQWQVSGIVARTRKGANDLDEPFVPGPTPPPVATLEDPVHTEDEVTVVLRWWPASGVDLSLAAGFTRASLAGAAAATERHAALAFRLTR
jgi:hypothetical protein